MFALAPLSLLLSQGDTGPPSSCVTWPQTTGKGHSGEDRRRRGFDCVPPHAALSCGPGLEGFSPSDATSPQPELAYLHPGRVNLDPQE